MAEAPKTMTSLGAVVEHLLDRLGQRRLLVRHPPLGDDRGARRRDALAVTLSVLSTILGLRPGSSVETTPSLRMR